MPTTDILVTGASGYLAHRLVPLAASRGATVAVSRQRPDAATLADAEWQSLDLLDPQAVSELINRLRPSVIINGAAANPGAAESYAVNTQGAGILASAAAAIGARLVHVSSDTVHGGEAAPYVDDAEPTPINDYGRSKAEGEVIVRQSCPGAVVVRTSLIYSLERMDRGTAGFAERLERGETLDLWADAIRQPVWADALSESLLTLALDCPNVSGSINVAGEEAVSRAEFGRQLLGYWNVDTSNITLGSARDVVGQPLDLTMAFGRARELALPIPALSEVLSRG